MYKGRIGLKYIKRIYRIMHYLLVLYISISQDVATQLMMMMCKTTEISHHFDLLLKVSVFLAILSGV